LKLDGPSEKPFPLLAELEDALQHPGTIGEWQVLVPGPDGSTVKGRICAIRKSTMATVKAQKKLKRRSSKSGEKLKPETLLFAKYIILFTTFPEDEHGAQEILDEYRYRWQIELIFKRLKQLAQLGHLPKSDPVSAEAWLYGKLLVAMLTQKMIHHSESFSPWGYDLEKVESPEPLA
jgi:hypothetical protein